MFRTVATNVTFRGISASSALNHSCKSMTVPPLPIGTSRSRPLTRERRGEPYRAFPLTRGLIGRCARTGKAWRSWKTDDITEHEYREWLIDDMKALELTEAGAQEMDREVSSLL